MENKEIVSHDAWLKAGLEHLAKEKEFTRLRDELSQQRRELPWEQVDKPYLFEGPAGEETLADLFAGRHQLIVYHFMFGTDWDEGCPSCSFWADNFNGIDVHLEHRDTSFVAISHAPLSKLEPYKKRMGWDFKWVSSAPSDFNFDYQASFTPEARANKEVVYNYAVDKDLDTSDMVGVSVFYKDDRGKVFHTYSTYSRGVDMLNGTYRYLDLTPKGRDEEEDQGMFWLRRRDQYDG